MVVAGEIETVTVEAQKGLKGSSWLSTVAWLKEKLLAPAQPEPVHSEFSAQFLKENGLREGVTELPSGLQYKVLTAGRGERHPAAGCSVVCRYEGRVAQSWPAGDAFVSNFSEEEPEELQLANVIAGWAEAMQLMVEGDKWEVYIPADLGYGSRGSPPDVAGGDVIVFVVEVIEIKGASVPCPKNVAAAAEAEAKIAECMQSYPVFTGQAAPKPQPQALSPKLAFFRGKVEQPLSPTSALVKEKAPKPPPALLIYDSWWQERGADSASAPAAPASPAAKASEANPVEGAAVDAAAAAPEPVQAAPPVAKDKSLAVAGKQRETFKRLSGPVKDMAKKLDQACREHPSGPLSPGSRSTLAPGSPACWRPQDCGPLSPGARSPLTPGSPGAWKPEGYLPRSPGGATRFPGGARSPARSPKMFQEVPRLPRRQTWNSPSPTATNASQGRQPQEALPPLPAGPN